jgi:hypothetical protein
MRLNLSHILYNCEARRLSPFPGSECKNKYLIAQFIKDTVDGVLLTMLLTTAVRSPTSTTAVLNLVRVPEVRPCVYTHKPRYGTVPRTKP